MSTALTPDATASTANVEPLGLVPRLKGQGYSAEHVAARRAWVEEKTGARLRHVGSHSVESEEMRGNVENPVGAVQVPLGVAGPLFVEGAHARGQFYVPLATNEGALVRSYERGMAALARACGAKARVYEDENRVSPVFSFEDVADAHDFARGLQEEFDAVRAEAEATTRHGRLLRLEPQPVGREVIVNFCFHTADAHGMNMIVKATEAGCLYLMTRSRARRFYVFSGYSSEKRASGVLLAGGKGKKRRRGRAPARAGREESTCTRRPRASATCGTRPCSATYRRTPSATTATTPTGSRRSLSRAGRTLRTSSTLRSA